MASEALKNPGHMTAARTVRRPQPALIAGRARSRTVQRTGIRRQAIRCLSSLDRGICRSGTRAELGNGTTGGSGFDLGRGRNLFRLIVGNQRIGVWSCRRGAIAAGVVDDRIVAGELGQMQGLGTEVGQGQERCRGRLRRILPRRGPPCSR